MNDSISYSRSALRPVRDVIITIQESEAESSREYRGVIASARRLFGKPPESNASSTADILRLLASKGFQLRDVKRSDDGLTKIERSAVSTLSLYAGAHRNAHKNDITIGQALAQLSRDEEIHDDARKDMSNPMVRSLINSDDYTTIVYHLSRIIQRLDERSLDYLILANDLMNFQQSNDQRERVKIQWAKDYYRSVGQLRRQNNDLHLGEDE
jgi:CRISPR type I-E-associated protein CasB/Cse2